MKLPIEVENYWKYEFNGKDYYKKRVLLYSLVKQNKANISHIARSYNASRRKIINICSELNKEVAHWSIKCKGIQEILLNLTE